MFLGIFMKLATFGATKKVLTRKVLVRKVLKVLNIKSRAKSLSC